MKCPFPMKIKVKGKEPEEYITVPCGKCIECKLNRQQSMAIRVYEEKKDTDYSVFLTLTYEDEHLPITPQGHPTLNLRHVQLYLKRVRKELSKVDIKLRYIFVGEYGDESYRPHYHALLFFTFYHPGIDKTLRDQWPYGFSFLGTVRSASINYVLKYCLKQGVYYDEQKAQEYLKREERFSYGSDEFGLSNLPRLSEILSAGRGDKRWELLRGDPILQDSFQQVLQRLGSDRSRQLQVLESISEDCRDPFVAYDFSDYRGVDKDFERPFQTYSRNPGIGYFALNRLREEDDNYVKQGGVEVPLPRYYREKLWTDDHKENYRKAVQKILEMDLEQNSEESVRLRQERHEQFLTNLGKRKQIKRKNAL